MTKRPTFFLGGLFWLLFLPIVLGPSKALLYASGGLVGVLFVLTGIRHHGVFQRYLIAFLFLAAIHLVSLLLAEEVRSINLLLSFVLFSWVAVAWALAAIVPHSDLRVSAAVYSVIRIFLILELVLGYAQWGFAWLGAGSADGALGDYVEGTFSPGLASSLSLSNPLFAIALVLLCLSLLSNPKTTVFDRVLVFSAGLLFVLASVVHLIFFALLAVTASMLVVYLNSERLARNITIAVGGFAALLVFMSAAMPNNFSNAVDYLAGAGESYKVRGLESAVTRGALPEGFGLGTMGGRAYQISSGYYRGLEHPLLNSANQTQAEREIFAPLQIEAFYKTGGKGGSLTPYSSVIVLIAELGVLGVLILVLVPIGIYGSVIGAKRQANTLGRRNLFLALTIFNFLFLIGAYDLYWDVPSAMLLGTLCYVLCWASYKQSRTTQGGLS